MKIKFQDKSQQEQAKKDQLIREAERRAREDAMEAAIEEKMDHPALDKIKNDIASGKIKELPERNPGGGNSNNPNNP